MNSRLEVFNNPNSEFYVDNDDNDNETFHVFDTEVGKCWGSYSSSEQATTRADRLTKLHQDKHLNNQ